jgi:hypothetical protein
MSEEKRKLKGIKYEQDFFGDSSKVYGEKYLETPDGEKLIDPITNKPITKSFEETHGDRIFGALADALTEKADDPEEIQREYDEMVKREQENQKTDFGIGGLKQESVDSDSQKHAVTEFQTQEQKLQESIKKEEEEYKHNFEKLSEKIAEQEKILNEVTEKFNTCKDKEEKIKLYHQVHEEMNKLIEISSNYGQAVQSSDTSSVIESLSSYDYGYDEGSTRKYIKDL